MFISLWVKKQEINNFYGFDFMCMVDKFMENHKLAQMWYMQVFTILTG